MYRAEQLIFLDESGINTNMGERKYGWGPKGKKIVHKVTPGRSLEHQSIASNDSQWLFSLASIPNRKGSPISDISGI